MKKTLCGFQHPRELPKGYQEFAFVNEPALKRRRLITAAKPKPARTCEVTSETQLQRRKLLGKQNPLNALDHWNEIFNRVDTIVPRVGRINVRDSSILQDIQTAIHDKRVVAVVACRGTNRTLSPPDNLTPGEAPYRKCVFIQRGTQRIFAEDQWEDWTTLSKRQLVRSSHARRLNITVFAANLRESEIPSSGASSPNQAAPGSAPPVEASRSIPNQDSADPNPATEPDDGAHDETTEEHSPIPESQERLTQSQQADLENPKQPQSFRQLPKHEQHLIIKMHKNLGHPGGERLGTILVQQGYRPEITRAAREYVCSVRQQDRGPKQARPSALRDDLDFNDRMAIDGVT